VTWLERILATPCEPGCGASAGQACKEEQRLGAGVLIQPRSVCTSRIAAAEGEAPVDDHGWHPVPGIGGACARCGLLRQGGCVLLPRARR
jgi:hypothetical protein